ncbi:hypothetical protein HDV01_006190 [Terramyces sp. JEL0728]|nr:hypothetical protein HDV01_006190 [Terramyces sp. JEL0728]
MSILPPIKTMKSPITYKIEVERKPTQNYEPLPTIKKSNSIVFETPVKPIVQGSKSTSRKRRSGWWDNKEQNIDMIKDLIKKNSNVKSSSHESLNSLTVQESKPSNLTAIQTSNLSEIATAAETYKQEIEEKPKKKERPPWYSEPLPALEPTHMNERYSSPPRQVELTPTPPTGTRRKQPPRHKTPSISNKIEKILDSSTNQAIDKISIYKYLLDSNMEQTAENYRIEAQIPDKVSNKLKMEYYIRKNDFGKGVVLVQKVMASLDNPQLIPSFEDLIYVLGKYLLLYLNSIDQVQIADRTLKMVIWPLVQKEQKKGGVRADWFTSDYHLLNNLLSESPSENNIYKRFNWEKEIQKFWDSISLVTNPTSASPPLFAYALAKYFNGDCNCTPLRKVFVNSSKLALISTIVKQEKVVKYEPEEPTYYPTPRKQIQETAPSQKLSLSTDMSKKSKFGMDQMPPLSYEQENTSFAIAKACGPSPTPIRVMDVKTVGDAGQIIAATAGTDKNIIVWDVGKNTILNTLQNNTVKPIVCLNFHPSFDELMVSADMEFDVKLWNWKEGNVVRWWKKHHTRIINQIGYIPGDDTRKCPVFHMESHPLFDNFILISSDHQLRLFDLTTETLVKKYSPRINRQDARLEGHFSPQGTFVYSGTLMDQNGNVIKEQESFTGCSIWKVHSGKLEQRDTDAMEDVGKFEFLDKEIGKTEVVGCKWYSLLMLGL